MVVVVEDINAGANDALHPHRLSKPPSMYLYTFYCAAVVQRSTRCCWERGTEQRTRWRR